MENWAPWVSTFQNLEGCVLKDQLKGSDVAGVFWTNVNRFLRFLSGAEMDDDQRVVGLRRLFEEYVNLEGARLKEARLQILGLCLKICAESRKR